MLRLGFFQDFKSENMVLLTGTKEDICALCDRIGIALSGSTNVLALHDLASVAPNNKAKLFVVLKPSSKARGNAKTFFWLCSKEAFPEVEDKLSALGNSKGGHHYFDLEGSNTKLMVSVGEYNDDWWQKHG